MQNYLRVLGLKVRDRVTGFDGVVSSVSFDLYGCVMCVVTPPAKAGEKKADSEWFDHKRLEILGKEPVMAVPSYALMEPGVERGPQAKSIPPGL